MIATIEARGLEAAALTDLLTEQQFDALVGDTLVGDVPAEEGIDAAPAAFVPDTEERVDWVLCRIADARARAARIRENAEKMARAEESAAESLEWRFGADLQRFLLAKIAGSKKKSVRLHHGVLGYRTKPAGVCVTDPAAALSWARENLPAAVTEALDKEALSAALTATGEAVPFAAFQPAEEVFYIR